MKIQTYNIWSKELKVLYFSKYKSVKACNALLKPGWFSMILMVSGTIDFIVGSSTVRLSTGQLYAVPNFAKAGTIVSPVRFYLVSCTIAFAINNRIARYGSGYLGVITNQSGFVLSLSKDEMQHMIQLAELLKKKIFINKYGVFQDEMVLLCLNLILYEYSALYYKKDENALAIYSRTEKIVMDFIDLIQEYSTGNHDVKFYADSLFVSKGHLRKAVRRITGMSAKYFIEMAIVSEAYLLLADDDLSITDIAEQLNFRTLPSFSIFFKKYTKLSPTQYRLKLRH
ncbi:AraC family transcriptional regulator [Flavobacterium sp. ALJ2]|uniref:helix-turn-helix domain-containing protein n=1 Tax=Flavobacterium sp. ALJ2 TaxID=2786960 RepID=UPI00189CB9B6|nr:AraC family transcriptional regulator [Flavobacterium sp. ALJ2]MBF7092617.1 AraC family transcriptional regulator [Flavobacterium sp. ALJ2]